MEGAPPPPRPALEGGVVPPPLCLGMTVRPKGGWKKFADFFVPPPLLRGYPPKKKLAPPVGIFFRKEDLHVTFTFLHCAP